MSLKTPRRWYRRNPPPSVGSVLLAPVGWLWATATARKIATARALEPPIPVICVGNLTVGGTGKTPIVRALARRLDAVVLSRGHGGSLVGPLRVDPAVHASGQVGDEPLMLARDLPVWIARDRAAGVLAAAKAGARAVVMDDGHQNPSVTKTLSLVVVDGETRDGEWPFGDGAVFPAGPLREPLAVGLRRADAVVLLLPADVDAPEPQLLALFGATPVLIARLEPEGPPPAGPLAAFAGIGKPWIFERALKAAGGQVRRFTAFPDHAPYDEGSLKTLSEHAAGATLITTEKDWFRLPAAWRGKVAAWPVRARFEDEAALERLLRTVR